MSKIRFYPSLFVVALLLGLRGSSFLSQVLGNAGLVFLGKALAGPPDEVACGFAVRAEALLWRATTYDAENNSAWRGLGFALEAQGEEEKAVIAWRTVGDMAQEFIQWGEQARSAGQYQEALEHYERAWVVSPDLADPWYYTGLAYEEMAQWEQALAAYDRALQGSASVDVGQSSIYYRKGVIYQWRLEPRQVEKALAAYEAAIESDDFNSNREAADCHYRRGEILRWMGTDSAEYIAEYRQATDLDPGHAPAHIYLGVAYYALDGDVAAAEAEIRQALALGTHGQWAYYQLGEIYRQEGKTIEAIAMYERALEIDPSLEVAQKRLQSLDDGE